MNKETFKARLSKIFKNAKGLDKVLLVNTGAVDPNFLYVTGFTSGLFEYSYLIFGRESCILITSALEYETAKEQASEGVNVVCIGSSEELKDVLSKELEGLRVGINESFVPVGIYKSLRKNYKAKKLVDVSERLEKARLVKDDSEIAKIRKAVGVTKLALVLIQKEFKEGMTEAELAAKFDSLSASLGSEGPSFKTIVCFGKNAALPHHFPDGTKLGHGDIILIDAGAKEKNYCSDMTRTFIFGKERSGELEEMMRVVKDAQLKAIKAIRPGLRGKEIDKTARDYIESFDGGKYKGKFIHSLGHSLGIEVHDGPGFSPKEETVIRKGMVITVEPGIYINGFGGVRIEDDVLVTNGGSLVL